MTDKLGMIAFAKCKALEKRIKVLEDYVAQQSSSQNLRDNP